MEEEGAGWRKKLKTHLQSPLIDTIHSLIASKGATARDGVGGNERGEMPRRDKEFCRPLS